LGEAEHVEVVAQQHAVLLLRKKLRHNRFKQIQSLTVNLTNQKQIIIVIEAGVLAIEVEVRLEIAQVLMRMRTLPPVQVMITIYLYTNSSKS
jgi:hypothetical protein